VLEGCAIQTIFKKKLAQIINNFSKIHQKKINLIYSQIVQVLQHPSNKGVGYPLAWTHRMRGLFILVLGGELGSPGKQTDGNCYNKSL
jgi:hypothetical protein